MDNKFLYEEKDNFGEYKHYIDIDMIPPLQNNKIIAITTIHYYSPNEPFEFRIIQIFQILVN